MDKKIFPDEPEIPILPNLFTAGNLVCGFFAILTIFEGINLSEGATSKAAFDCYQNATFLIFAACLFDLFDGRVARMRGVDGPFGREFDSLADIVSFGIAPALLVAKAVLFQITPSEIGWGIGILYLLCAALRLARFNCMAAEPKKEGQSSDFVGLPVPMAAGAVVSTMYLIMYIMGPDGNFDLGFFKYIIALAMAGVSILMMSRVIYPSFKHVNFNRTKRGTMYGMVGVVLTIICIVKFPWVMPAVIFSIYLLYGLIRPWLTRRWQKRLEINEDEENEQDE